MRSDAPQARRWFFVACLLLCAACATPVRQAATPDTTPLTATLFVVDRGWHTDIGLRADDITGALAALKNRFPGAHYLSLGFGERAYITARDVTVGTTLRALLPSQSALLVTGLRTSLQTAFGAGKVVTLHVTAGGLARLEYRLWQEFERTPADTPVSLGPGPYAGSEFFAALGTYDAFHTCNTWTATMLATAGLPVSASGVIFAHQILNQARAVARRQSAADER